MLSLVEVFNLFGHGNSKLGPVLLLPCIVEMHCIGFTFGGGRSKCKWVEIVDALFRESYMMLVPGEECTQS